MEGYSFRFQKHPVTHFSPAIYGNSTVWKVFKTLWTVLELRFNFVFCSHWICKYYSGYSLLFPWGRERERLLVFVRPAVIILPIIRRNSVRPPQTCTLLCSIILFLAAEINGKSLSLCIGYRTSKTKKNASEDQTIPWKKRKPQCFFSKDGLGGWKE